MRVASLVALLCWALLAAVVPPRAQAEDDGLADLDRAIEAKVAAQTLDELGRVIALCQSAIDKGLAEEDEQFAIQLVASTLLQRASIISSAMLDAHAGDPRWIEQVQQLRPLALADLTRTLEYDGDQAYAHYLLGRLEALPGGDRTRAYEALSQAIRLCAADDEVLPKALAVRGAVGEDPDQRQADFDRAIDLGSRDEEVLRARALFYLEQEKFEEALADAQRAVAADPDVAANHEALAGALVALERTDEAVASLERALELEPRSPGALTQLARVHLKQGKLEAAREALDRAQRLERRNPMVLMLRADVHQRLGDLARAKADVDSVLRLLPDLVPALRMRAGLLAQEGKLGEATTVLERVAELAPDDPQVLTQLGIVYASQRQFEKAIAAYTTALEKSPEHGIAYQSRADAYLMIGQQAEALADYEEALKRSPENSSTLNNLAWLLCTSPDERLRDGQRAVELATEACRVTQYERPHILSTLAAAYAEAGDFDKAIEWSTKAVEQAPEDQKANLAKELESYQQGKPWRELQTLEDHDGDSPSEAPPSEPAPEEPAPAKPPSEEPAPEEPAPDDAAPEKPAAEEPSGEQPAPGDSAPADQPADDASQAANDDASQPASDAHLGDDPAARRVAAAAAWPSHKERGP